ncbi:MAG TPA: hypothetical protein VFY76_10200 [Nocardioides sp.]|nr:hypothetical protein [Nocardioides sp.]
MYDPKLTFLQSELTYRSDRLRSGLAGGSRRHRRVPRLRRPAEAVDRAR